MCTHLFLINILIPLILNGQKTATWRLFDDKNLKEGEEVEFLNSEGGEKFATARLVKVLTKKLGELTRGDKEGHEKYKSDEQMYSTFSKYYLHPVKQNTEVKIIYFELI